MTPRGDLGGRSDPFLSHNFIISLFETSSSLGSPAPPSLTEILEAPAAGFSECSGLEMSLDVEEYNEGGRNGEALKFPTRVKWSNLTLKRGIGSGTELWGWHFGFVEGRGKRRDGHIILLNDLREASNIWYFRRGLPVKYTGPTMNASQSSVAIESIEIAHEGIYQLPFAG